MVKKTSTKTIPKKRGRRPKKILDSVPGSNGTDNADSGMSIILKIPYDVRNDINSERDDSDEDIDHNNRELTDDSEDTSDDMFEDNIPNATECCRCPKLQSALDCANRKIAKYEKEEKIANSNKVYTTNLNLISYTTGEKIKINKTKIRCRWDGHRFDTLPCFLPEYYKDGCYYVTGCFCSFNCALSYNLYFLKDNKMHSRKTLVYKLYQEMYGIDIGDDLVISEAPPVEILEENGGYVSIQKYRKSFHNLNKKYIVLIPPIKPIGVYIEEVIPDKTETISDNKYVLKRDSPRCSRKSVFASMKSHRS